MTQTPDKPVKPDAQTQRRIIEQYCTGFPEQNADGVDLSLIRANLRLTPTQRIRKADAIRRGLEHLRKHARRVD